MRFPWWIFMEHRPLDWFKIIIYFQDKVSDTSVSSPYIFPSPKKTAWPLAEFDISCGITKAKTMTITSITKVGGEVPLPLPLPIARRNYVHLLTRQLRLAPFFDCSESETSVGERRLISPTLDDFMVNTGEKWTFEKRLGNSQCTHVSPARESS